MLNFELCTETERREAAAIERRRAQDEERKKRIFGPKAKIFIDHAALDEQIQQKMNRDAEEKNRDAIFDEHARQFALMAKDLEEKAALERKKLQQEINEFRLNFQTKASRREADINDEPMPARMFDDDPRCGLSSMQKFEGEDIYAQERRKIQAEQTKVWLDQQMDEKERGERERREAEEAYREATRARDQQAQDLDKLEKECRQRLSLACTDYNKALADERDRMRRMQRREDEQDTLAHKYNVMMSDMLLEAADSTTSAKSKGKGMSRSDRVALFEEQKQLAKEARERKEFEKRRDKEFAEYANGVNITAAAIDNDLNLKKQELSRVIAEENLRLSREQRDKELFLKKVVYTNRPTDEFYDQFNKTAR
ncbi:RIB43A-like with coiled-coils protein 2 [Atheta coriaria]|uniref:RIB43A-like with coiled-coils protein 2 n=1 Tax=Dalotia coriaria TaxID=877792 RepID=UPI0031F37803